MSTPLKLEFYNTGDGHRYLGSYRMHAVPNVGHKVAFKDVTYEVVEVRWKPDETDWQGFTPIIIYVFRGVK